MMPATPDVFFAHPRRCVKCPPPSHGSADYLPAIIFNVHARNSWTPSAPLAPLANSSQSCRRRGRCFSLKWPTLKPTFSNRHVETMRSLSEEFNEPDAILIDLSGPKIRLSNMIGERIYL